MREPWETYSQFAKLSWYKTTSVLAAIIISATHIVYGSCVVTIYCLFYAPQEGKVPEDALVHLLYTQFKSVDSPGGVAREV